ncbi:MAG: hypothetical protein ACREEM_22775, partial [Blastocatellia bacterium]
MIRAGIFVAVLAFAIVGSSCASWVRTRDYSIPKLITPLADAKFDDLIKQLRPFTELQALRTTPVYLRFLDAESSQKYFEANSVLVLQRPDKIRLLISTPAIGSKIADMVSEANKFKVAIYYGEYKRFLLGTSGADYSAWRARIGEKGRSALAAARPFHFTEALMLRPIQLADARFAYAIEESLVEEDDTRKDAKKGARVLRSFYVISEVELQSFEQGPAKVRRRFWFDRTNGAQFSRQQIFDDRGGIVTEVFYSNYAKLNADGSETWPSVVLVSRPHDGYSARLTFNDQKFDVNPTDLGPGAFTLENTEGLPITDLD